MIAITFVIAAALGAVAGVMIGTYYGVAHYQMGFLLGLKAFSAAVLGGIGNLAGAMLGGLLLGLIEALGAGYVGDLTNLCHLASWSETLAKRCETDPNVVLFGSNYQDVFAFIVLILVLVFRPSGLLGDSLRSRLDSNPRCDDREDAPLLYRHARQSGARLDRPRDHRRRTRSAPVSAGGIRRDGVGADHEPRDPVRLPRPRPQHRRRLRGLARSGLHRVLRGRRVRLCAPRLAALQPPSSVWIILPIGAAVACLFGALLGAPTLKLRGDYLAIVTLGFGEIVRIFLNNLSQPVNITNGPQGVTLIDPFRIGTLNFKDTQTFADSAFRTDQVLLPGSGAHRRHRHHLRLQNSRIGRAWEAIREDESPPARMGINTRNMKLLAFAMGASFGGVAGGSSLRCRLHQPGKLSSSSVDHGACRWSCSAAWGTSGA